ncbi:MAG: CPBP family intramembrane metalloprotease [Planctomycetes bacterium]|nr:CPBP family intramembrane metalloprotease [Planctomycetota bacterium]
MSQAKSPPLTTPPKRSPLASLDAFMASHPFNPRLTPFAVYLVLLSVLSLTKDLSAYVYPTVYALQCAVVAWLLWRYRKLTPELTVSFHWSAVPSGVFVLVAWIAIGMGMERLFPSLGQTEPHFFEKMRGATPWVYRVSIGMRLLGMSLLVPLFEEMFTRSLMLRCLHSARATWVGLLQVLQDVPVVGDWIMETGPARRAAVLPGQFTSQFEATGLGVLSLFGVAASTAVFTLSHAPRDWPACVVTGVTWCLLLAWTRRRGLGPIAWSHGITNALLWGWTLYTNDWRFM